LADDKVIRRLDALIAILRLAHSREIVEARTRIRADEVNNAVLEAAATDFVGAGELKKTIAKATKQSEKTVQRRVADLLAIGALEKRTSGPAAYRSTGLI
jgi:Lon protease-like protein